MLGCCVKSVACTQCQVCGRWYLFTYYFLYWLIYLSTHLNKILGILKLMISFIWFESWWWWWWWGWCHVTSSIGPPSPFVSQIKRNFTWNTILGLTDTIHIVHTTHCTLYTRTTANSAVLLLCSDKGNFTWNSFSGQTFVDTRERIGNRLLPTVKTHWDQDLFFSFCQNTNTMTNTKIIQIVQSTITEQAKLLPFQQ